MDKLDKSVAAGLNKEKSARENENKMLKSEIGEWVGQKQGIDKKIKALESQISENDRRISAIQHTFDEYDSEGAAKTEVDRRRW